MPAAFWCLPLCWRCWRWWSAACGTTALATPRPRHRRRPIAHRSQVCRPRCGPRPSPACWRPGFGVAVLAAAVAYAVMSSIMTATPLHLNATGLPLDRTAVIIQKPRHRDVPAVARQRLHHGSPGRCSRAPGGRGRHDRIDRGGGCTRRASWGSGPHWSCSASGGTCCFLGGHRALGAEGRRGRTLSPAGHQRLRRVRRAGAGLPVGRNRGGPGGVGRPQPRCAAAAGLGSDHRPGTARCSLRQRPSGPPSPSRYLFTLATSGYLSGCWIRSTSRSYVQVGPVEVPVPLFEYVEHLIHGSPAETTENDHGPGTARCHATPAISRPE